ncbi:glycosyltransferase family 2 protein [Spirobacillus cienkowskii]|uniref:glycosyltransferase family 2 protein n=1 Tax=Spirobacillus cienkowskii TaxID=495820 RepID=UPI0030D16695
MEKKQLVSVIVPVYNSEKYLVSAIESVLRQTYINFELICIYDDSSDSSLDILQNYSLKDNRVKIIKNNGKKISGALNTGLNLAKGEYIARMDTDDISLPKRLEIQVDFLNNNPDYVLCSTNAIIIDEDSKIIINKMYLELENVPLEVRQIFENGVAHPSVMFRRKEILEKHLCYKNVVAEDYQFWFDIIKYYRIKRIPDCLLMYRSHKNNLSLKLREKLIVSTQECQKNFLQNVINLNNNEIDFFMKISQVKVTFKDSKFLINKLVNEAKNIWKISDIEVISSIKYLNTLDILFAIKFKKIITLFFLLISFNFSFKFLYKRIFFHFYIKLISLKNKLKGNV